MKLQILHLDPHDDNISTRDKLAWAKADRVLLVWPSSGEILQRRLDLVLIHREAARRGLVLGLLSYDPQVRDNARGLGIPVFDSLDDLPEERWERYRSPQRYQPSERAATAPDRRKEPPSRPSRGPQRPWVRYPAIALAVLALLSLAWALIPRATLFIEPTSRQRSGTFSFSLRSPPSNEPSGGKNLPSREIDAGVTVSERIEASGRTKVPSEHARGILLFTNLTGDPVDIPEGASTRSLGEASVRAVTLRAMTLPAGEGTQGQVEAMAAEPGEAGNLPPETIRAVDGTLGLAVSVANPAPFEGGASAFEPTVTEGDLERLREAAVSSALEQGLADLEEAVGPAWELVEGSLRLEEVLAEEYEAEAGELAASVGLTMTARIRALAFSREDLVQAIERQLATDEANGQVWRPIPDSVELKEFRTTTGQSEAHLIDAQVTWRAYRPPDGMEVRSAAAGLEPEEVAALASAFDLQSIRPELWPSWSPRLPFLPSQISLRYIWEGR